MVKFGVKTYYKEDLLECFKEKADFFEVMALIDKDYSFLKHFSKPIVIHAEHSIFGINPADKNNCKNLDSANFAIKIADSVNSNKIILHPGAIIKKGDSKETAISFIRQLKDKRILIENLPKNAKEDFLCTLPEEVGEFMKKTGAGFCLDINHAIITALYLKRDYMQMLREFIELKPAHYHLGGQRLNNCTNDLRLHICFENSDLDLKEISRLLPNDAEITIETETDIKKIENDLRILKSII